MSRKLEFSGVTSGETVIGAGVKVTGDLISEADITIDGRMTGNIRAAGNVNIGVNAKIKGDVKGVNVTIAGQLKGNIEADGETAIAHTGKVSGNIVTGLISIESGGVFLGKSSMTKLPEITPEPDTES